MKAILTISMIAVFTAAAMVVSAQDYPDEYLGLPGDNLNLYAVMNLFQESETLEGFERNLNDQETTINNLDLNNDGLVDYITVSDFVDDNVHNIVLRAALNGKDQQDIAVFVVEKLRNGEVMIQLIGDKDLYGPNYIVEPIYAETPNPGYSGNVSSNKVIRTNYNEISIWPLVRFMYNPRYVVWRSSWYYGYYPSYWNPWTPHYYHYYYGYHSHWNDHYYRRYHHYDHYRSRSYNNYYYSNVRVHSPAVVVNIKNDRYRSTYSRPDQRGAGEAHYTRTASTRAGTSKTGAVSGRQGVTRTESPSNSSRSSVSTSQRKSDAVRGTSTQRSTTSRTSTARTRDGRSSNKSASPAVQRSSSQNRSTPTTSRSSSSRSTNSSTTTRTTRSTNKSTPATSRSSSSKSKSTPAVSRSSSSKRSSSRSSSTPSTSRSSSSKSKSTPAVSRSSSSKSKSSSSVSKSSSNRKSSSAQRSQPSRSKSSSASKKTSSKTSSRR